MGYKRYIRIPGTRTTLFDLLFVYIGQQATAVFAKL